SADPWHVNPNSGKRCRAYRAGAPMSSGRSFRAGALSRAADQARDDGDQLGRVHGLRHMDVEAGPQAPDAVLGTPEGRERYRRDLAALLGAQRSQLADQRVSV